MDFPVNIISCCGIKTEVADSRPGRGTIRRRRRCTKCGNAWSTVEVLLGQGPEVGQRIDAAVNALLAAQTAMNALAKAFTRPSDESQKVSEAAE